MAVGVPVPVEPTVYVERVSNHTSCAWQAAGLACLLRVVERQADASDPVITVDTTSAAGRQRVPVSTVEHDDTNYVRFDPSAPWRLAWERRTTPVVTLDGTVSVDLCRQLHRATTDCTKWSDDAVDQLGDLLAASTDDTPP